MFINAKLLKIIPHKCILRLSNYNLCFISVVLLLREGFFFQENLKIICSVVTCNFTIFFKLSYQCNLFNYAIVNSAAHGLYCIIV